MRPGVRKVAVRLDAAGIIVRQFFVYPKWTNERVENQSGRPARRISTALRRPAASMSSTTESAVRITPLPPNIVGRGQTTVRSTATARVHCELKVRLYEARLQQVEGEQSKLELEDPISVGAPSGLRPGISLAIKDLARRRERLHAAGAGRD